MTTDVIAFTGRIATVPGCVNRRGGGVDVVLPGSLWADLPIRLHDRHDLDRPVGIVLDVAEVAGEVLVSGLITDPATITELRMRGTLALSAGVIIEKRYGPAIERAEVTEVSVTSSGAEPTARITRYSTLVDACEEIYA